MNIKPLALSLTSAFIGASLVLSLQASAQHEGHDMGTMPAQSGAASANVRQLHEIMMKSAKKNMSMPMPTGVDVDKHFSKMMADHHMTGIQMADVEIRSGRNAEVKALARKIKAAQTKERAVLAKHAAMNHK